MVNKVIKSNSQNKKNELNDGRESSSPNNIKQKNKTKQCPKEKVNKVNEIKETPEIYMLSFIKPRFPLEHEIKEKYDGLFAIFAFMFIVLYFEAFQQVGYGLLWQVLYPYYAYLLIFYLFANIATAMAIIIISYFLFLLTAKPLYNSNVVLIVLAILRFSLLVFIGYAIKANNWVYPSSLTLRTQQLFIIRICFEMVFYYYALKWNNDVRKHILCKLIILFSFLVTNRKFIQYFNEIYIQLKQIFNLNKIRFRAEHKVKQQLNQKIKKSKTKNSKINKL